jgi:hypothetical protein
MFSQASTNLIDFFETLPVMQVKFIWLQSDLTFLSQSAATLTMHGKEYYVRRNATFYYLYSKSGLTFLLHAYRPQNDPIFLYNRAIIKKSPDADVYQGNHLTVGLTRLPRNLVKVNTHETKYTHDDEDPNLIQTDHDSYCNFELVPFKSFEAFRKQLCYKTDTTIQNIHQTQNQHLIYKFCTEAFRTRPKTPAHGGAKKNYGEYKGVNHANASFARYLVSAFRMRETPMSHFFITMDEESPHMMATIEYAESRTFFVYMHVRRLMKAAYASDHLKTCSKLETACLNKMNACISTVLTKMAFT